MKTIKAIVIDDTQSSRGVMMSLLRDHSDIELCGVASDAPSGIKLIMEHLPDVIFLDVEMPGMNGLELVDELKKSGFNPHVVFTTGFHNYAIEALRKRAFDYLLKPIDADELEKTLTRLRIQLKTLGSDVMLFGKTSASPARLRFNTRAGFLLIDPDEIVYCQAAKNYTDVFTDEKSYQTVTVQIGKIAELLEETTIKRLGKSYLININYIKEIDRKKEYCQFHKNGKSFSIELSETYLKQLDEMIA